MVKVEYRKLLGNGSLESYVWVVTSEIHPLFYLLLKSRKANQVSNPSRSPRHARGRYFQQTWALRSVANDGHWKRIQRKIPTVTLTRNINSQEKSQLNSRNHINIKAELYRAQTGFMCCYNCQTWPRLGQLLGVTLPVGEWLWLWPWTLLLSWFRRELTGWHAVA
jgi:hypothetical protein